MEINNFVKEKRKKEKLTQPQLALKTSVGLRFIRELEKGKKTLRTDKVNQVLNFFGYKLGAVEIEKIEDISSKIYEDINSL
jgi:y4mF family transcriptional regulator